MAEHIRIGDVAPRVHYVADGSQTVFVYPFPIFGADDIEVHVDGLRIASGYAVSGAGKSEGGTTTFAVPPAAGALPFDGPPTSSSAGTPGTTRGKGPTSICHARAGAEERRSAAPEVRGVGTAQSWCLARKMRLG